MNFFPSRRRRRSAPKRRQFEPLEDRSLFSITPGDPPGNPDPETVDNVVHLPAQYSKFDYSGFLTPSSTDAPVTIAERYLRSNSASLGLLPSDVDNYLVTTNYVTQSTGATTLTFQQSLHGLPVKNANFNITVMPDGRLLSVYGGFVQGLSARANQISATPAMSSRTALTEASEALGLTLGSSVTIVSQSPDGSARFNAPGASLDEIVTSLEYVAMSNNDVKLAWSMKLRTPDGDDWYNASIDASTGDLVSLGNYVDHARYEVYALPATDPVDSPRTIEIDPHEITPTPAIAPSPFGWHDTNGAEGAEFTITRGNNTNTYADRNDDDQPDAGSQPDGGASLNFTGAIVAIDLTQVPSTYTKGAVANLFYWTNILHDVHYLYGFDEAARNFQVNNYGRGGVGNDAVDAEAQDGSGTNNANFFTPPDGLPGRMQMYEFDLTNPGRDGDLDAEIIVHEYGHGVSNRLTGNGDGLDAVQSGGMGEGWSDWWSLMFAQETANEPTVARGVGTYVLGQPANGPGIRDFRYDFDITNPAVETFTSFNTGSTQVHESGTRWAATLWDINKLLIDKYGFEPNISNVNSSAGNVLAMKLVMNALKIQPLNPTFIQARDAILSADLMMNGGSNYFELWTAFARRGLGANASTTSANSTTIVTSFEVPPLVPVAVNDSVVTQLNTPVGINVLANDRAIISGAVLVPSTLAIVAQPTNGSLAVAPASGVVTYTPNTNFVGTDTFTYRVADSTGLVSNIATVTIQVNAPPVAVNDSASTITNVAVVIPVLANDTDTPPGTLDPATVIVTSGPTNGSVSINTTTGAVTYTPANAFSGNDSFTYTVKDNNGAVSNAATVSIFVNAPPIARDDTATTQASVPVGVNVLANDNDPTPGGSLVPSTVTVVTSPTSGQTSVNPVTGVITYTPNLNFSGTDTFTYTVKDNNGATSNVAKVTILVNFTPVAIDDVATTPADTVVQINVTTNDIDSDDGIDPASAVIITPPSRGTATISNGVVTYTPNVGFVGADFLTYRVKDSRGALSNIATVVFKVGSLHSLSGKVYVDLNDDKIKNGTDWAIGGVTIYLDKTDGPYIYTDLYVTEADGTYNFTELATGNYTIREQHPGYFNDGPEVVGTLPPASISNDNFVGIALASGVNGTGYDFTEDGLRAEFVAAYSTRQAYFASGEGMSFDGINLGKGEAFVALNGGVVGQLQASALSLSGGSVALTLYDTNMKQVAKSAAGSTSLNYTANSADTYFLKVSGTSTNVSLNTFVVPPVVAPPPPPPPPPARVWHNATIAQDVDGDGDVELDDIIQMIDAVNRHGVGSLTTRTVASNFYLDVDDDATLTLGDVIPVIDAVNRRSFTASSSSGLLASQESSSSDVTSDIAFALAVDAVLEEEIPGVTKKRR